MELVKHAGEASEVPVPPSDGELPRHRGRTFSSHRGSPCEIGGTENSLDRWQCSGRQQMQAGARMRRSAPRNPLDQIKNQKL